MINGRILGVDYGTKRIGLAISDENKVLAFPKDVIPNDAETLGKIAQVIKEENITEVVVGESRDYKGEPNVVEKDAEVFARKLVEDFGLPIHRIQEFLTSVEARRQSEGNKSFAGRADASAAALILQRYLDRRANHKNS